VNEYGHWLYDGDVNPEDYYGFVYCITNLLTGRKYIGRKYIKRKVTKKPLKGRVNKRRASVVSNWQSYTGSCKKLNQDIERDGYGNFEFKILSFYKNRWDVNYNEVKAIIDNNAILDINYYNECIHLRLRTVKNSCK
jgi:hypothetical protein